MIIVVRCYQSSSEAAGHHQWGGNVRTEKNNLGIGVRQSFSFFNFFPLNDVIPSPGKNYQRQELCDDKPEDGDDDFADNCF